MGTRSCFPSFPSFPSFLSAASPSLLLVTIPCNIHKRRDKSNVDRIGIFRKGMDKGRDNKKDMYADKSNVDRIGIPLQGMDKGRDKGLPTNKNIYIIIL
jgi:hypothetical protein